MLQEASLMLGSGQGRAVYGRAVYPAFVVRKWRDARLHAEAGRLQSALTRRPRQLLELPAARSSGAMGGGRYAGLKTVSIARIRGSEGRSSDFDREFYPLRPHDAGRWMSVAAAREDGVALPPVQLIQVGDAYYVRDGHHRISVARAMGQLEIEAEVTVWDAA